MRLSATLSRKHATIGSTKWANLAIALALLGLLVLRARATATPQECNAMREPRDEGRHEQQPVQICSRVSPLIQQVRHAAQQTIESTEQTPPRRSKVNSRRHSLEQPRKELEEESGDEAVPVLGALPLRLDLALENVQSLQPNE